MHTISLKSFLGKSKTNKNLIISFVTILSGFLSGVVIFILMNEKILSRTIKVFLEYHTVHFNKTSLEIFCGILLYNTIYFVIMFIVGGSLFGRFLAPAVTLTKSLGITIVISYLYCEYALKGLEYTLLVFFPGKSLLIASFLFMTKICIDMSNELIKYEKNDFRDHISRYYAKSALIFFMILLSGLFDLICIKLFSPLFDFQ